MKITITPQPSTSGVTVTPFTLADDSAAQALTGGGTWPNGAGGQCNEGFRSSSKRIIQNVEYFRSPYAGNIARYNQTNRLDFTVQRTFDTLDNCLLFMATHPAQVPTSGTVAVQFATATMYLPNSVVESVAVTEHNGVSCSFRYSLMGSFVPNITGAAGTGTGGPWQSSPT